MNQPEAVVDPELDGRIFSLLRTHRTLKFTSMAEAIPEYKWYVLLSVLHRLREQRRVVFTVIEWDYEISLGDEADARGPQDAIGGAQVMYEKPKGKRQ